MLNELKSVDIVFFIVAAVLLVLLVVLYLLIPVFNKKRNEEQRARLRERELEFNKNLAQNMQAEAIEEAKPELEEKTNKAE